MTQPLSLSRYLDAWAGGDELRGRISETVQALGAAMADISLRIASADSAGSGEGGAKPETFAGLADDLLRAALADRPVAHIVSEKHTDAVVSGPPGAPLIVTFDPLDGSSNIDTNLSIGTIFSILPVRPEANGSSATHFLQPGRNQLAAGYVIYGPKTVLVLSVGAGTAQFVLDRREGGFWLERDDIAIPQQTTEFAINASNSRYWDDGISSYVSDCLSGRDGPAGRDYNMRWVASLVAECHRILVRGGVFLYPSDERKDYRCGRLHLIFEANPIAFLIEQAGGAATDCRRRVLDLDPGGLDERTPLVFGSRTEVERIGAYALSPYSPGEHSPLFGRRGLFRT